MTPTQPTPPARPARPARPALGRTTAAALAGTLALSGCSFTVGDADGKTVASGNATSGGSATGTSCNLSGCTVVLERGVDARASVLGIDVEVVGVTGDKVTLQVAGQQVTVPLDGNAAASVAGFDVRVESANDKQIVLRLTRGG